MHAGQRGQPRYIRSLMLTLAAVTVLVLTNNLLLLVLAWIGTSLALHALLTFFEQRPQALIAAHKKFLASRLADDTGSADARQRALAFIFGNWTGYLFAGEGLTASYTVARGAGLETSIESSILMYAVDVGWALALVYFCGQFGLIVRHGFRHRLPGASIAAVAAFALPQVSSALAWSNMSGTLLWTTLAVLVLAGTLRGQPEPGHTSGAPVAASIATSSRSYRPAT